jgi:hypothetical protein
MITLARMILTLGRRRRNPWLTDSAPTLSSLKSDCADLT